MLIPFADLFFIGVFDKCKFVVTSIALALIEAISIGLGVRDQ